MEQGESTEIDSKGASGDNKSLRSTAREKGSYAKARDFVYRARSKEVQELLWSKRMKIILGNTTPDVKAPEAVSPIEKAATKKQRTTHSDKLTNQYSMLSKSIMMRTVSDFFHQHSQASSLDWHTSTMPINQSEYIYWSTEKVASTGSSRKAHPPDSCLVPSAAECSAKTESTRKKVFPCLDRWLPFKVMYQRAQGLSYSQISCNLQCNISTVRTAVAAYNKDGLVGVIKLKKKRPPREKKLKKVHGDYLAYLIRYHQGMITLGTMRQALLTRFTDIADVSISSVWNLVRRELNYSHRKVNVRNFRAGKQDREIQIAEFTAKLEPIIYYGDEYWALDESGVWQGQKSAYGWGPIGQNLIVVEEPGSGVKYSLIVALSSHGRYALQLVHGGVTGPVYAAFLSNLASLVSPANLMLITDNAPVHHSSISAAISKKYAITHLFLPPYLPEANPVEYFFAALKLYLNSKLTHSRAELTDNILGFARNCSSSYVKKLFCKAVNEMRRIVNNFN